jgi:calcineurin-like phosphoesterase family protein
VNRFFTSDTHFDHIKALEWRPMFSSIRDMNEALVENWNQRVKRGDHVYHLGDFGFFRGDQAVKLRKLLNGEIHLIMGNHDDNMRAFERKLFASVRDLHYLTIGDRKAMLCHYPMASWRGSHRGSVMLHGHCHGRLPEDLTLNRIDVGVDSHNFSPISIDEVIEIITKRGVNASI